MTSNKARACAALFLACLILLTWNVFRDRTPPDHRDDLALFISHADILGGSNRLRHSRDPRAAEKLVLAIHYRKPGSCIPGPCQSRDHDIPYAEFPAIQMKRMSGAKTRFAEFVARTSNELDKVPLRPLTGGGFIRHHVKGIDTSPSPLRFRHRAPNAPRSHDRYGLLVLNSGADTPAQIVYTLRNFLAFTGPCWGLVVVHAPSTEALVYAALRSLQLLPPEGSGAPDAATPGACVVALDRDVSYHEFNDLLKTAGFWQDLPGEHLQMFQTDSLFLKRDGVDPFIAEGWDYVGSPWRGRQGGPAVGNGGFSLRRRQAMIDVATEWPDISGLNEDVYFVHILLYSRYWVATPQVALRYSAEQLASPDPAGAHQLADGVAASQPWATFDQMIQVHRERLAAIAQDAGRARSACALRRGP